MDHIPNAAWSIRMVDLFERARQGEHRTAHLSKHVASECRKATRESAFHSTVRPSSPARRMRLNSRLSAEGSTEFGDPIRILPV